MKVPINIDGKIYQVRADTNVLEACLSLKMDLPYFCWHPAMGSVGACRQCGIISYRNEEDEKGRLVMACMEPVREHMRISLEAPEARDFRAANIEALMINHPHDCPVCDEGGECHLQDMTVMTGHAYRRYRFNKRTHNNQDLGPFINHEMNRCIQCYRCVRFYNDYAGGKDFGVFAAHDDVYFGRHEPGILEDEFSGNLIEVCPTGVFTDKTLKKHYTRKWDFTNAPSVCHNCSLGCNIIASERYGSLRRIRSRYNDEVNGYFICDRGRFGYEYVNDKNRLFLPLTKENENWIPLPGKKSIEDIREITQNKNLIGIGSPKASLESNFLLRQWVGGDRFYAGIPESEGKLIKKILKILKEGTVKTPSLAEVKNYDAVLVLGEDVTNTAPMLALHLRQTVHNQPLKEAKDLGIPAWDDAANRRVIQDQKGPFFTATLHATKLDEIATRSFYGHPDDLARLAYLTAWVIDPEWSSDQPADPEEDINLQSRAAAIAEKLRTAKKPLIVSGTSLYSEAIIDSAATLATALQNQGKEPGLVYIVPEVNSLGLTMLSDRFLEEAFDAEPSDAVIIMENDLYHRKNRAAVDSFLQKQKNTIVLHYLQNETTRQATWLLPAATFAEADGTVVNNEGRAQRFYKTYPPENDIRSSWQWIRQWIEEPDSVRHLDDIVEKMIEEFPELKPIHEVAPDAGFREGTQKIPREPHRYSGRTAMHANVDVHEPKPPEDFDSALSYTMEGFTGVPPAPITPFYWTPGWNSVQAINKYQIEVGGPLHGGRTGKRLIEASQTGNHRFSTEIPSAFVPKKDTFQGFPLYHIYGSDELSAQSPAVQKRIPTAYLALNDTDAKENGIQNGDLIEVELDGILHRFRVQLHRNIPKGIIGLPKGLQETAGIEFPFEATIKPKQNE